MFRTLSDNTNRPSGHAERVLADEETAGAILTNRLRFVGLPIIAVFIFIWVRAPMVWFIIGCLAALLVVSLATSWLRRTRHYRRWQGYVSVLADFAVVAFAMFGTEMFFTDSFPAQAFLDNRTVVYFFFVMALLSLTYSPWLMLWGGVCAAVTWSLGVLWVASLPGTVTALPEDGTPATVVAVMLQPNFVDISVWQQDVIVILLTAGVLAAVAWRSRRLVRRQITSARERANLARYFPPTLVDNLAQSDTPLGKPRASEVAVLFADVVGFTPLAERQSPEQVIELLRDLHARLETAVFDNGGTLDKFLGDGLMATFGTPEPRDGDAARALTAGRAMLDAVAAWNVEREAAGRSPIRLAIGLHTGPVVLGDIGTERRMEFAVIGDTVNIASRLQELTREHGARLAASGELIGAAGDALTGGFQHVGSTRLRGRTDPTDIWTLA